MITTKRVVLTVLFLALFLIGGQAERNVLLDNGYTYVTYE